MRILGAAAASYVALAIDTDDEAKVGLAVLLIGLALVLLARVGRPRSPRRSA